MVASAVDVDEVDEVDEVVVLIRHLLQQPEPRRRDRRRAPEGNDERDLHPDHVDRQGGENSKSAARARVHPRAWLTRLCCLQQDRLRR
jgi:hypothetical protein